MQQPIRYYITKSGDEPTVRSVKVSLGAAAEDSPEPRMQAPATASSSTQDAASEHHGVKQIVRDAIRKRAKPS